MNILFLSGEFLPFSEGGSGVVAYNLAKGLKGKGHNIFIITTAQSKLGEGKSNLGGLKVFRIYSNYHPRWQAWLSLYNPQTVSKVKEIIKETKPDIVHAHNIHHYLSYHCLKIARKYAKAIFLTAHDVMLIHYGKLMPRDGNCFYKISIWDQIKEARKRYNPFRNVIIRCYLKYVDKVFAVSNSLKKLLEINGLKNVETAYNGIDIDNWKMEPRKVKEFKERYNLQNKKIILFGGRLSNAKGGEVILRAMVWVTKTIKDAVLLVAGKEDWYAQKLLELAQELEITNNIKFTGWLDREVMKCAFFACDVCVTPSIYLDPFNLFNIEAGASKRPVVGTCFGGTPEIVLDPAYGGTNTQTGYIVNPNNIKLMAEKIIDLLKNPGKARRFGEAGYERVKEKFSLNRQVDETLRWYKKYL
ncbi:MAG: glycosyltransferase family 4 protein [Patescibacteria group bacterium]